LATPRTSGSGDEPKIRRALSSDLSDNLLDTSERTAKILGLESDPFGRDRRVFAIKDWETENAFRDELFANPSLRHNPWFLHQWDTFRDAEAALALGDKTDVLSFMSLLNPDKENETRFVPSEDLSPAEHYFRYFEGLGADRSGQLEEVVGPMGSGKSNFLAWKIVRALGRGSHVFANFRVRVDSENAPRFHEVHRLSQLILETVRLRRQGHEDVAYWVIDEQGANLGGASRTSSTLEGRWATAILTKSRKLGVFLTRARQQENVPQEQMKWVSIIIRKDVRQPDVIRGSYVQGDRKGAQFAFSIPNMGKVYDTRALATFTYDLDMEEMETWIAAREGESSEEGHALELMERFAREALQNGSMPRVPPSAMAETPLASQTPQGPTRGGTAVECAKCGHKWVYRGRNMITRCPNSACRQMVRVRDARTAMPEMDDLLNRAADLGAKVSGWRSEGGQKELGRSITNVLREVTLALSSGRTVQAEALLSTAEKAAEAATDSEHPV
jgi:hypothetical protein